MQSRDSISATTLAEEFTARGYATALFGKWHLARGYLPPESAAEGPDRQGFAETFITHKPSKTADPEKDAHGAESTTARALGLHRVKFPVYALSDSRRLIPPLAPGEQDTQPRLRHGHHDAPRHL